MIYTYSPNWYKPQCLHLTGPDLYYSSNYILYHYSLPSKSVTNQLCFRGVAVKHHLNHKDIKINAINSTDSLIIVGINQPHLALVDKQTLTVEDIVPLEGFQSVEYIHLYKEEGVDTSILCDKDGHMVKYRIGQPHPPQPIEVKVKLSPVKAIYWLPPYHFLVFTRGTIILFNQDFSHLLTHIQVSHQDTIYSVDHLIDKQQHLLSLLTKNKEKHNHILTLFTFKYKEDFPLEMRKKVEQIGEDVRRINVNLQYPNKMADKVKINSKACLSIKWLDRTGIIMSGKMGEVFTLSTDRVKDSVNVKPYSMEEQEEYRVWSDSRHYKEIYTILEGGNRLYMVSTDHNLTVWEKNQSHLPKYIYSLKFLTSSISFFFTPQHDPHTIFALLKDSNLRSFAPLQAGSHQLSEYWKHAKKYKIKKAVPHPSSEGVMALSSDCNRLQIYDIYQDRLMKLFQIGEEIISISFQSVSILKQIESLFKVQCKQQKIQYVSHFVKKIDNKVIVMVQTTKNVIFAGNLDQKEPWFKKCTREKRIERIHQNNYWDGSLLLASQTKQQALTVILKQPAAVTQLTLQLPYPQGRVLFKYDSNSKVVGVVNFKGNRFSLTKIAVKEGGGGEVGQIIDVVLQIQIDYLFVSHTDWRAITYCQREDALVLIHLDMLELPNYSILAPTPYAELYRFNGKIDTLCFYMEDYLVVATKDQSIKVVPYRELQLFESSNKELQKGDRKERAEPSKEQKEKKEEFETQKEQKEKKEELKPDREEKQEQEPEKEVKVEKGDQQKEQQSLIIEAKRIN